MCRCLYERIQTQEHFCLRSLIVKIKRRWAHFIFSSLQSAMPPPSRGWREVKLRTPYSPSASSAETPRTKRVWSSCRVFSKWHSGSTTASRSDAPWDWEPPSIFNDACCSKCANQCGCEYRSRKMTKNKKKWPNTAYTVTKFYDLCHSISYDYAITCSEIS